MVEPGAAAFARRDTDLPGDATQIDAGTPGALFSAIPALTTATVTSPVEALAHDEVQRMRRMAPVSLWLMAIAMIGLPLFGGHRGVKIALYVSIVFSAIGVTWTWRLTRDEIAFTRSRLVPVGWYVTVLAACVTTIYFGIYSAGAMLLALLIYLLSMSRSCVLAYVVYATAAVTEGGTAILIATGVIADPGLFHASYLSQTERIVGQILLQGVLIAALLLGRATRRSSLEAFTQLANASRAIAQREAMVAEARHDLRRVQQGGGGRLSGRELGSFTLGEVIGRGGMGEVYRAIHRETGEPAAVKVLHAQFLDDPECVSRFVREASTAASLDTPHVARVLELARGGVDSDEPYIAMELLSGQDLAHILLACQRLTDERLRELLDHVASGLDTAADAGIVHRDIKPNNLFYASAGIDTGGVWKILDFGIARLVSPGNTLTLGSVLGTPAYMAPEQARGMRVDHRADVYSLAAITYRALTGFPPFSGDSPHAILFDVVASSPRRPSSLAELPADVDFALAIGMAPEPADRFARASELAHAIETALAGDLAPSLRQRGERVVASRPWR